jgi:four helix bundle protein
LGAATRGNEGMTDYQFRFQDLDVWKRAADLSPVLFGYSEALDGKKLYRFAEQLRAATLSITNNIAEGSGSTSKADFRNFLNMARRSVFEVANMLILFGRQSLLSEPEIAEALKELEEQSRMLLGLMRSL